MDTLSNAVDSHVDYPLLSWQSVIQEFSFAIFYVFAAFWDGIEVYYFLITVLHNLKPSLELYFVTESCIGG